MTHSILTLTEVQVLAMLLLRAVQNKDQVLPRRCPQPADPLEQVDPSSDMDRRLLYSFASLLSVSVTKGKTTGQSLKESM